MPSPSTIPTRFRPTAPSDEAAIAAFLAEAFAGDRAHPQHDAAQYRWKYWQPRAEGPPVRSFVLEREGRLLAHAGVVPGRCLWAGGELHTLHLIEWAARPDALGAGTTLLKRIAATTGALLAIGGNPRTLALLPALGFRDHGQATPFIRSLRPLRLARGAPGNWRTAAKVMRGLWWALGPSLRTDPGWHVQEVPPEALADHAWPQPRGEEALMARGVDVLREAMDCPATPMRLFRLRRDDRVVQGYFLLALAPGQARLADCGMDSPDPADWQALVRHAVHAAHAEPTVAELLALASDERLSAALHACGFHARAPQPIRLLCPSPLPFGRLQVQMLDNDAAWLHGG